MTAPPANERIANIGELISTSREQIETAITADQAEGEAIEQKHYEARRLVA